MSIQVLSTGISATESVMAETSPAASPMEKSATENPSAPEADLASEQKESEESDTSETEAKESDESEEEAEESDASKDASKDKPKKKGGFQRRIDKLNARNTAVSQELEYWKQQALRSQKDGAAETKSEKVETQPQGPTDGKPNPDRFDTHVEYVEALTDWKIAQTEKSKKQEAEKSKLQTDYETVVKAHSERVKTFADKTEDFYDVLENVDHVQVSPAVQELLLSSENGPELMYELAKNREEYERICRLPPLAAARELGKIESKLSPMASEKPEPKRITSAPKPLEPVKKGAAGSVAKSIDDPNLSQAEYERIRRDQMRRKQG